MDAVILGASPNALSAARSLGRAGLEVVVAAARSEWTFKRSRYVARFVDLDDLNDADIATRLIDLPESRERPFLLATGDRFALFVARHVAILESKFCFISPSYAVLEAIIDKAKLYQTAKRSDFPHPAFHVVAHSNDVDHAIANVPTPCYVKPALAHQWRAFNGRKLERAETEAELRRILGAFIQKGATAIALEIIPGSDSDVVSVATYIDRSGRPVGWRTKRKLRQYPVNAGDATAQEICDEPEVAELGLKLLAITEHRGPATVEFRRDTRNGRLVLMEINARTILGQEMITRSGFDVPLTAYREAKGEPPPPINAPSFVRWLSLGPDFGAFRELRKQGSLTTPRWLASIFRCRAFAYFAVDDLCPCAARIEAWLRRQIEESRERANGVVSALVAAAIAALAWAYSRVRGAGVLANVPVELDDKERINFLAVGRQGYGNQWAHEVAAGMARVASERAMHFVILTGDNFHPSGVASVTDMQWRDKFERLYSPAPLADLPFFAVLGNHDHEGNASAQVAYSVERCGSGRWRMPGLQYHQDFGRVGGRVLLRIVFLDTESMSGRWKRRLARSFLTESMALPGDPIWRVVVGHAGVRSHTQLEFTQRQLLGDFGPLMRKLKVDLVLSGNDHFQQLLDVPGEPLHVSTNGGGGKLEQGMREEASDSVFIGVRPGFSSVTLDRWSLEVAMMDRHGNATYRKVRTR